MMLVASTLSLLIAPRAAQEPKKDEANGGALFNGKDLDGWTPKITGHDFGDNYADTFRVEDGVLKVRYDKYKDSSTASSATSSTRRSSRTTGCGSSTASSASSARAGPAGRRGTAASCSTARTPRRCARTRTSRCRSSSNCSAGSGKGKRPTANMCSPGTNVVLGGKLFTTHCTNSKSKTYNGDVWVTAEVEVHGSGTVKHFVEGELVLEYEKPQLDPKDADAKKLIKDGKLLLEEGYISLQSESHPCEFRKVEIKVLKK